ncbi:MAG: polysaccharide pyruvyl transferase CsaB [Oscillospiraceae bacterium]|nr:polysaccharide pyruvyl transferase CsaB [Oscillospiraceae bacterium]
MKLLHLIGGGDVGGAKTHVITLLGQLSGVCDVTLISFREGEFAEEARKAGINVVVADGSLFSDMRTVKKHAEGCDILHCHGARANMVGALMRRRLKIPVVTTVHSDYLLDYMGRFFARITYGVINKFALRRMDYRIGVSDRMTQMLIERGFRAETLFTIYNGMDFSIGEGTRTKSELAAELGLEYREGDVFVGIAARFDPVKDIATFVRAAARLKETCPRMRFLAAGSGGQNAYLRRLAAQLDAPVTFLGWLEDTRDFFRLVDINVLTSLSETFPYALTEGTRMRCATVATAVGGIPHLIDHGVNGFLFEPSDDAALARYIGALYEKPEKMLEMGDRLHNKARVSFSLEATLTAQTEIYDVILRRSARPRAKRDGITLCGAYGMDNAGDDAILEAILQEIRQQDLDIPVRVLSRNPLETRLACREHTFHTFNLFAFTRATRRSTIYLSGGGNLVQDTTSSRSLWFYLFTIYWARKMGCRVLMYGCGIGPIVGERNRRLTTRVLDRRVETITLREEGSREELKRMGVTNPRILTTADPALILTPAEPEKVDSLMLSQQLPPGGRYIGFALRNWPGLEEKVDAIARAADYAYHSFGLTPVYIPIERKQDIHAATLASSRTSCPHILLREAGTARVAIGLMCRMEVVVAMRLHALIFAAGQGIPVVGIAYNEKVSAFLDYIGQNLSTPLEQITVEQLIRHIENAVGEIPDREKRLRAVNRLREKEKLNQKVLGEMLKPQKGA